MSEKTASQTLDKGSGRDDRRRSAWPTSVTVEITEATPEQERRFEQALDRLLNCMAARLISRKQEERER